MCVNVCVSAHAHLAKRGLGNGAGVLKKAHNIQVDSQTCTRLSGKIGHEPKDS